MPQELEKHKQTNEMLSFTKKYRKAVLTEEFLKAGIARMASEVQQKQQMLQKLQQGMQMMVKAAPVNKPEVLAEQTEKSTKKKNRFAKNDTERQMLDRMEQQQLRGNSQ